LRDGVLSQDIVVDYYYVYVCILIVFR